MVSFRNSQFQAIIWGLVIADTLSHGQSPWALLGPTVACPSSIDKSVGAITDDRWSHAIATQCTLLSETNQSFSPQSWPVLDDGTEPTSTVPASVPNLLVTLPRLLAQLDQCLVPPVGGAVTEGVEASIVTAFRKVLKVCLRQDKVALRDLQQPLQPAPPETLLPSQTALCQAIEVVLAAQGDFQLVVGQSLQSSATALGVPVLAGVLSASWGDLPSLPTHYRHWLYQPPPDLQVWLQRRWQITTGTELDAWSASLWRHWTGCPLGPVGRSLTVAVVPPS